MHTYRKGRQAEGFDVGIYLIEEVGESLRSRFQTVHSFEGPHAEVEAAAFVHFLNGGATPELAFKLEGDDR